LRGVQGHLRWTHGKRRDGRADATMTCDVLKMMRWSWRECSVVGVCAAERVLMRLNWCCVDDNRHRVDVLICKLMWWWLRWCVGVLIEQVMCWCVDASIRRRVEDCVCVSVLVCWCGCVSWWHCVDVLMFDDCWCVDVLMCWSVSWAVDLLICWYGCIDVLMTEAVSALMCWCVDDIVLMTVLGVDVWRWSVDVLMTCVDGIPSMCWRRSLCWCVDDGVGVLMCCSVDDCVNVCNIDDCVKVLTCWCVRTLICWCVDVLMIVLMTLLIDQLCWSSLCWGLCWWRYWW
jgi:hypothetical protein